MNKKIVSLVIFAGLFCVASISLATETAKIPNYLGVGSFNALLLKIAGGVGQVIASLGVIMIIVSGILYLISAGIPEKMAKAKTALIYAITGIVIGIAATTIVEVVKDVIGTT